MFGVRSGTHAWVINHMRNALLRSKKLEARLQHLLDVSDLRPQEECKSAYDIHT